MWSFIKICPICIICINWLKEKFHRKTRNICNYSFPWSCSKKLSSFRFIIKQQWSIEEISIFNNSSHLEWRAGLSDTILKGTHPRTIPARFGLIWFRGFRGEDLNVEVYDVRQMDAKWWQKLTWPLARWANKYWLPFIISQEIWLSTFYTIYSIYLCVLTIFSHMSISCIFFFFTSVWNLLSQRYNEVLIGLKGSKSMLTFFSFPSSVTIVPQYITRPFVGTEKQNYNITTNMICLTYF